MAELFRMPMLGQSMEEGTVVRWYREEGDTIRKGETLLEIMTDKANMEVEAPSDGFLRKRLANPDETVPVGNPIAILSATSDEPIEQVLAGGSASPTAPVLPDASGSPAPIQETRVVERELVRAAEPAGAAPVAISPRARRTADELGIPAEVLAGLGSGPSGRVLEKDVRAFAARVTPSAGVQTALAADGARAEATNAASVAVFPGETAIAETIPLRGLRKAVADNVARSRQTAPHVTLVKEVDMEDALALLAKVAPAAERSGSGKLTPTHLIVKAVAFALGEHPLCNAALVGEEIRVYSERNIGLAVATEGALLVPVIRYADRKGLFEIAAELRALAERCRTGRQTQEDLSGGTFTITNLGAFGVDLFDPILVPPQACILGVGSIAERAAVWEGKLAVRKRMNLCLSFDHRVLDGVPAAQFLKRLAGILENPALLLT